MYKHSAPMGSMWLVDVDALVEIYQRHLESLKSYSSTQTAPLILVPKLCKPLRARHDRYDVHGVRKVSASFTTTERGRGQRQPKVLRGPTHYQARQLLQLHPEKYRSRRDS